MGGAGSKSNTIRSYNLFNLTYQKIQLDKLMWSIVTCIIKI